MKGNYVSFPVGERLQARSLQNTSYPSRLKTTCASTIALAKVGSAARIRKSTFAKARANNIRRARAGLFAQGSFNDKL